jgi:hypothetical protein
VPSRDTRMTPGALPPGCEALEAALARLDARVTVVLRVELESGRSADGVRRVEVRRDGGVERLVLDGRALRPHPAEGRHRDVLRLAPEGECERVDDPAPGVLALRYDAWAERGSARVTVRIDAASGLPRDARREAPELAWGRALSRPTKPPQAALRPTGRLAVERIGFDYSEDPPRRGD